MKVRWPLGVLITIVSVVLDTTVPVTGLVEVVVVVLLDVSVVDVVPIDGALPDAMTMLFAVILPPVVDGI
jgi:hypothetical protein